MLRHARGKPALVVLNTRLALKSSSSTRFLALPPQTTDHRHIHRDAKPSFSIQNNLLNPSTQHSEVTEHPETASESQAETFNLTITRLRHALKMQDIECAGEQWAVLKKNSLLCFLGPSYFGSFSKSIASVLSARHPEDSLDEADRDALFDISLAAAGGRSTEGLQACMIFYLRRGEPKPVFDLFMRYSALSPTPGSACEVDSFRTQKHNGLDDVHAEDSGNLDDLPMQDGSVFDIVSANEVKEHASSAPGRFAILLAVITAHAMEGNFLGAMKTYLDTSAQYSKYTLRNFLPNLNHDRELQKRVDTYVKRLEIARLVASPALLASEVASLGKEYSIPKLENLYNSIMDGLSGPDPFLAVEVPTSTRFVVMPQVGWTSFLTYFVKCRRSDLAEKLWDDMLKLGMRPGVAVWTALFNGYSSRGALSDVLKAWESMLSQGIIPDVMAYRALIFALFAGREADQAMHRFRLFEADLSTGKLGSNENHILSVKNTVLHGLLTISREQEALDIFKLMQIRGPKPDIVTFNTFLQFYSRKGDFKGLASIVQNLTEGGHSGDVFTYSTIMSALLKIGREDASDMMVALMEKQGVKPNVATYTAIIDHQVRERDEKNLQGALRILTKMENDQDPSVRPNQVTYTTILAGLYSGQWLEPEKAEEYRENVLQRMKKRNLKPNRVTYHVLLKTSLAYPPPQGMRSALRYYTEMVERKIPMARDTWYIILKGLVDRQEWSVAESMLGDMFKSGFRPVGGVLELVSKITRTTRRGRT